MRRAELNHDIDECAVAEARWDAVNRDALAAESLVLPERRNYYQAGVLTMVSINRESNRMLLGDCTVTSGLRGRPHREGAGGGNHSPARAGYY
jgi:hypothetical protein